MIYNKILSGLYLVTCGGGIVVQGWLLLLHRVRCVPVILVSVLRQHV